MKFDLRRPCKDCPFRTDVKPYLTRERAADIADAITTRQQTFSCHKTTLPTEDGQRRDGTDTQHCAGALILLEKIERPGQMMRIAERLGIYDRTKLDMDSPVFSTPRAFVNAQTPRMGSKRKVKA